jgi:chemotaxis protein MotA
MSAVKNSSKTKPAASRKPDVSTICGTAVVLIGILGGLKLEGGSFSDVGQFTAAMIVLGGTAGAVMITTPWSALRNAIKALPLVFFDKSVPSDPTIQEIIAFAAKARKHGLVSLENDVLQLADPFLRKALLMVVDGTDLKEVRRIMQLEIDLSERHGEAEAKVFEAAGGFAPTIGIIGAVLGLIQVMKHLEDIEAVGHGIAVAFVATVYGVGIANLFLLPAAHKLKSKLHQMLELKELMLEGTLSIAEGLNPKLIGMKLEAYQTGKSSTGTGVKRKVEPISDARTANIA